MNRLQIDKYTIEVGHNDKNEYVSRILRCNESWIDKLYMMEGSSVVIAMMYELIESREKLSKLDQLSREYWQIDKVCESNEIEAILKGNKDED